MERRSAESSGADRVDHVLRRREPFALRRRVRRDDACEPDVRDDAAERVDLRVVEIGRDLHEERFLARVALRERRQQRARELRALERAEVLRVRRRDVHDDEVAHGRDRVEASRVICNHRLEIFTERNRARLADRKPDGHADRFFVRCKTSRDALGAFVRKPEAIDERAIGGEAKEVRRGVRLLRERGHRAELEEAKSERRERARAPRVLVEAAREANGRREIQAHRARPQARIARRGNRSNERAERSDMLHGRERGRRERVRRIGTEPEQERLHERVHERGILRRCASGFSLVGSRFFVRRAADPRIRSRSMDAVRATSSSRARSRGTSK